MSDRSASVTVNDSESEAEECVDSDGEFQSTSAFQTSSPFRASTTLPSASAGKDYRHAYLGEKGSKIV